MPGASAIPGRGRIAPSFSADEVEPMTESTRPPASTVGQALGRIPSGLFILTVTHNGRSTGMLASWVMQAGFDPPMVTVAVALPRYVGDWISAAGGFTLNQIPAGGKALIRHFSRGFAADVPAFVGLRLRDECAAGPVLADAVAYLDAEVAGVLAGGDHRIVLGRVVAGAVFSADAEPMVHLRQNGMHY